MKIAVCVKQVPDATVWGKLARSTLQLVGPLPEDWLDFGRQHRPNLTLGEVETAHRLAANRISLLAQLLKPAN